MIAAVSKKKADGMKRGRHSGASPGAVHAKVVPE